MSPKKRRPKAKLTTQTHGYDGKLPKINIPTPEKSLVETVKEIKLRYRDARVHQCCDLFLQRDNYDPLNKLNAGVLLRAVWAHLPAGMMDCFESVMIEIIEKGPCVQGRTIRLYQLWRVILDDISSHEDT